MMVWDRLTVSFGMIMFGSSALNNLFVTYNVEMFMRRIDPSWFFIGQIIFMIWNSVNDPLFGWILDSNKGSGARGLDGVVRVVQIGGVLWCLAFLFVWFAPSSSASPLLGGLHFTLSLCLYDSMLTLVEVAHSSLLAEITVSTAERAVLNSSSSFFAAIGSMSSFFGHLYFSSLDLEAFQMACACIALVCSVIFWISGKVLKSEMRKKSQNVLRESNEMDTTTSRSHRRDEVQSDDEKKQIENKQESLSSLEKFKLFASQLVHQRNLWVFSALYMLQVFDCTLEKSFFSTFLEEFTGAILSKRLRSFTITASFALPWITTLIVSSFVQRHGIFKVISNLFAFRLSFGLFIFISVMISNTSLRGNPYTALLLLTNRVMTEAVCRLTPLIVADLVDEDRFLHHRDKNFSGTIVGTSVLLGKASQSLAPMFGYSVFHMHVRESSLVNGASSDNALDGNYSLILFVPWFCTFLQLILWRYFYSLKGSYLKSVKQYAEESHERDIINDVA